MAAAMAITAACAENADGYTVNLFHNTCIEIRLSMAYYTCRMASILM